MDTKELKKRLIRGYMRPPYFYLPVDISSEPTEKIVHFVVSKIENPLISKYEDYTYKQETVDIHNYNQYGPYSQTFETAQGRIWISDPADPAFDVGTTVRNTYDYQHNDDVYVVKIYNGNRYIGYFFMVEARFNVRDEFYSRGPIRNYRFEYDVETYSVDHARCDRVLTVAQYSLYSKDTHTDMYLRKTGDRYWTEVDLSLFGIEGSNSRYSAGYLDDNFNVGGYRYETHSPEAGGTCIRTVNSAQSGYYNQNHFIQCAYSSTTNWWQVATANGIDLDKKNQGYYWQSDVQVDIPRVEWSETDSGTFSFIMYNARYSRADIEIYNVYNDVTAQCSMDPTDYHSFTVTWSGGDVPIPSGTTGLTMYYLGDGLDKATCALYQRAFGTNDYSIVGATSGVVEIEQ